MYKEHPFILSTSRLEAFRHLAYTLDINPGPGGSRCTDFSATMNLFRAELVSPLFDTEWAQAMVVVLYPSAQLVGHCDPPILGTRYHIPLQVNPNCWVHHAGVWVQLQEGHCYEMDPTEFHGAVNWGNSLRLHLAIDVL